MHKDRDIVCRGGSCRSILRTTPLLMCLSSVTHYKNHNPDSREESTMFLYIHCLSGTQYAYILLLPGNGKISNTSIPRDYHYWFAAKISGMGGKS